VSPLPVGYIAATPQMMITVTKLGFLTVNLGAC
jgi:hypothetical protein